MASIYVAPSIDLESGNGFSKKNVKLEAFFEWTPNEWTHCPWPLRMAPRRPEEAARDDPNHLWMQKSVFSKMLVYISRDYFASFCVLYIDILTYMDNSRARAARVFLPLIDSLSATLVLLNIPY